MAPLRREWDAAKADCLALWPKVQEAARKGGQRAKPSAALKKFEETLRQYLHRLAEVKIPDPACGSGNFLYVAINLLLDLEKQVIAFASTYNISLLPHVRPTQLLGIEINPFAQELAQVVIWIGGLQWMQQNGFIAPSDPVLEPFENIQNMDAILDPSDPANPKEPEWPAAELIATGDVAAFCLPAWKRRRTMTKATGDPCCVKITAAGFRETTFERSGHRVSV